MMITKMKIRFFPVAIFFALLLFSIYSFKPVISYRGEPVNSFQITSDEDKLYNLIMEYRKSKGLPNIPRSASLSKVAQLHVEDLMTNHPDKGNCNLHSWSNKGKWTPCCYTKDHKAATCMWSKPVELTSYPGNGYEISAWASYTHTPESSLDSWKSSSGHNAVIMNTGIWKSMDWKAIGVGMRGNYAVVWFGTDEDPVKIKWKVMATR